LSALRLRWVCWVALLAVVFPAYGGVLFTFNGVNVIKGTVTLFRLELNGSYELIQATSKDRSAAVVTNHVIGSGVDTRPLLAEVKDLADRHWLQNGKAPVHDHQRTVDTGDMITLLLVTYSGAFVEMRPLTSYPSLLHRFDALIEELSRTGTPSGIHNGILLTAEYVGTFDERIATVTDPYGIMGIPYLNKVFTPDDYTRVRQGGRFAHLKANFGDRAVSVTAEITLTPHGGEVWLQDARNR